MLHVAAATGDRDLRIAGHVNAVHVSTFLGEFSRAIEHSNSVWDLYDEGTYRHVADVLNGDPKVGVCGWASMSTWILGFPDRALRLNDAKDAHARRHSHPFVHGWALFRGAHEFDDRCRHDDLRKRAEECEQLGRENSLPVLWAILAPGMYGQALLRDGKPAEAITPVKASIAAWEATGGRVNIPFWKALLAEAMALTGALDNALVELDEAIMQIERPGWEERLYYAEIFRLKGWVLSLKGEWGGAERNFLTSLDWARRQHAKMWEVRTSTSYARLMCQQGRARDAYELLAPVYGWFTEGFATKDLQEAKALLEELET